MEVQSLYGVEYIKKVARFESKESKRAIFIFHGYGANMYDLYSLSDYLTEKADFFFFNGPIKLTQNFGPTARAWFSIDLVELNRMMSLGKFRTFSSRSSAEFNSSLTLMKKVLDNLGQNYSSIALGGFSQGAMLASHLLPSIEAKALLLFSGTLFDKKALIRSLDLLKKKISFFQSHGLHDQVLDIGEAKELNELLRLYGNVGDLLEFTGGHEIPMEVIQKAKQYLERLWDL